MRSYLVTVVATSQVLVHDVESQEEAEMAAMTYADGNYFEMDSVIRTEILKTEEDIERAERHCNQEI